MRGDAFLGAWWSATHLSGCVVRGVLAAVGCCYGLLLLLLLLAGSWLTSPSFPVPADKAPAPVQQGGWVAAVR